MRTYAIALAFAVALLASPAAAQSSSSIGGVVTSGPGFPEAALASCAGGAMIGVIAVLATGGPSPFGTAALFCGLSVAATAASTVTVWTWRKTTSIFSY